MAHRMLIRNRLLEVPIEHRRNWTDGELYDWWTKLRDSDGLEIYPDPHQPLAATVKQLFGDLIGKDAPM